MSTISEQKKAARKQLKEITKGLSAAYQAEASAAIAAKCLGSDAYKSAESIFIFVSMDGEPDTLPLIRQALADGKAVYVPRCLGGGIMEAVRLHDLEDLHTVPPYGIREPKPELPATETAAFDGERTVAFVPCVGATRGGKRLGHGAGYYDRFLEGRQMKKLMLAFERQILEEVPCDEHDLTMDRVITEMSPD